MKPSFLYISFAAKKGDVLPEVPVYPYFSDNNCILTFVVSKGCIQEVAIHPEIPPKRNGFNLSVMGMLF